LIRLSSTAFWWVEGDEGDDDRRCTIETLTHLSELFVTILEDAFIKANSNNEVGLACYFSISMFSLFLNL